MVKLLRPNKEYCQKYAKYQYIDGLLAIGLFLIMCGLYAMLAVLQNQYAIIKDNYILVGGVINLLIIAITMLFIKVRKEKYSSIGLCFGKRKQSCLIGLVLAAFLFFNNCLLQIIGGAHFIAGKDIGMYILYYLTVALCEEIVFRGYIGTRLYGLISNPYLVILVSGILFVAMHFPFRMIAYGMTFSELTIHNMGWLLNVFLTHIVLTFIYMKTNSLYGSVISHWMSDFAYNIITG